MTEEQQNLHYIGISKAFRMLCDAETIVLTSHMNPDGDALGSEGALCFFLKRMGKSVRIINTSPVPPNLTLLGESGIFEEYNPETHDSVLSSVNLIAVLDVNALNRLDRMEDAIGASVAKKLVIDHHTNPKPFADGYCIDTEISATGERIYDLIKESDDGTIDKQMALHLYVAIMTDTGSFRFERTTPKVHRIAAELLDTGLVPSVIHERVYDSFGINRTKLLGMVLEGISPICGGKATILTITRDMMDVTGTTNEDTEGMVNYGLGITGVKATALITELDGVVKISLRSRGKAHVNEIARKFGGGGHVNASAARIEGGDLTKVKQEVEEALCALFI